MEKLKIAVIIGTARLKRRSINAAKFVEKIGQTFEEVETVFVDPLDFDLPHDGDENDQRDAKYTKITEEADGFFIVVPEYNHSFPGSLKVLLDSEYDNYKNKPVVLGGVSSGAWGGTRAIESLIHVLKTLSLVIVHADINFPKIKELFDESGEITDKSYVEKAEKSWKALIWMAKVLKHGRENIE